MEDNQQQPTEDKSNCSTARIRRIPIREKNCFSPKSSEISLNTKPPMSPTSDRIPTSVGAILAQGDQMIPKNLGMKVPVPINKQSQSTEKMHEVKSEGGIPTIPDLEITVSRGNSFNDSARPTLKIVPKELKLHSFSQNPRDILKKHHGMFLRKSSTQVLITDVPMTQRPNSMGTLSPRYECQHHLPRTKQIPTIQYIPVAKLRQNAASALAGSASSTHSIQFENKNHLAEKNVGEKLQQKQTKIIKNMSSCSSIAAEPQKVRHEQLAVADRASNHSLLSDKAGSEKLHQSEAPIIKSLSSLSIGLSKARLEQLDGTRSLPIQLDRTRSFAVINRNYEKLHQQQIGKNFFANKKVESANNNKSSNNLNLNQISKPAKANLNVDINVNIPVNTVNNSTTTNTTTDTTSNNSTNTNSTANSTFFNTADTTVVNANTNKSNNDYNTAAPIDTGKQEKKVEEPLTYEVLKSKLVTSQSEFMRQLLTLKIENKEPEERIQSFTFVSVIAKNQKELLIDDDEKFALPKYLPERSIGSIKYKIRKALNNCLEVTVRCIRKYMEDCKATKSDVDLEELCLKLEAEQKSEIQECISDINEFRDPKEREEINELRKLLNETRLDAEKNVEDLEQENDRISKERDDYLKEVEEKTKELMELRNEINQVEESRVEALRRLKYLEPELDETRYERECALNSIAEMQNRIEGLQIYIEEQKRMFNENPLREQNAALVSAVNDLEHKLFKANEANRSIASDMREQMAMQVSEYDCRIRDLEEHKNECMRLIVQQTAEMEDTQKHFEDLKERHNELQSKLLELNGEVNRLKTDLEGKERMVLDLQKGNQDLQAMNADLQRELGKLRRHKPQSILTFEYEKSTQTSVRHQNSFQILEVEPESDEIVKWQEQCDTLKSRVKFLSRENSQLEHDWRLIRQRFDKVIEGIKSCADHAIQVNESKSDGSPEFHKKMRTLIRSLKSMAGNGTCFALESSESDNEDLKQTVEELRRSLEESRETCNRMKNLAETRAEILDACRHSEVSLRFTINKYKEEIVEKNHEIDILKNSYQEMVANSNYNNSDLTVTLSSHSRKRRFFD